MSRTLRFRAWDKLDQRWAPIGDVCISLSGELLGHYMTGRREEEFAIQQYTGLKDKNGREIYEGDIVVKEGYLWFDDGEPNYRGTVEWIYSQWQVVAHCVNPNKRGLSDGMNEGMNDDGLDEGECSDWEVIGNIYENPDLLKQ